MTALQKRRLAPVLSATKVTEDDDNSRWGTPRFIYDWLDGLFAFTLDVCADAENYKHPRYFTEKDNGLQQSWAGERAWDNPPYGKGIGRWVGKARDSAIHDNALTVSLLPHRADTEWWNRYVMQTDREAGRLRAVRYIPETRTHWYLWRDLVVGVYVHDKRIPFVGAANGAPFPSVIVIHASLEQMPQRSGGTEYLDPEGETLPLLTAGWPR